jgi:23S rRNA (uracil1939-C5)-methyltransferase
VEIATWGAAGMAYDVGGRTYSVTRNAFFQVNRFLTEAMVQLVAGDRRGEVAWDLFAGAGLFSVALAERFRRVVAVEISEPAATDLATQLGRCAGQHRAVRQTALAFLEAQHRPGADAPDLVVLDPPRAGLGMAAVRALIATGAREVVYVSCDAGSFARDARALVESGYRISSLHLLDLFPQTFHTETIAVLHR